MSTQAERFAKRPIALIGLRGSGKSAVGRELAKLLGADCVDTDEAVANRAGKSIQRIFAEDGERAFRDIEREAVINAIKASPQVVALGGGAVLDPRIAEALKTHAIVVWLTAPVDVLYRRIAHDPATASTRPALTGEAGITEMKLLAAQRSESYRRAADLTVDTSNQMPDAVAREILRWLRGSSYETGGGE